jgi:MoxR-like ATPase
VHSLTSQPTIVNGILLYQDSPLVRAVEMGYVLVVDEADKAPTQVTSILKSLVEDGELLLGDGRRIIPYDSDSSKRDANTIPMHPKFRMIVLAVFLSR